MSGRWVCAVKTCGVVQGEPHVDGCPYAAPAPDPAGDTGLRTRIEAALDDSIRFDRVEWVRAGDVRAALDGTEERS